MKEIFIELCKLWSARSYYIAIGDYSNAMIVLLRIKRIEDEHHRLSFFAKHLHMFFVRGKKNE